MTDDSLLTIAEQSGYARTGRVEEVDRLCEAYAQRWPDAVRFFGYGRSAEGRMLRALLVSQSGAMTPADIRTRKIPVLMIQGGIHPGESDGKDAGFIALRDLLKTKAAPLKQIAVLFVPAFNTDGHERFGPWNRPNQTGPAETGWRTTSQNLNLNRDYSKADTPEMRAMLRLINEWDPVVTADLHVTDGADFQPDISIQVEPLHQGDLKLRPVGHEMRDSLVKRLNERDWLALEFYPDLAVTDDPSSGFSVTVYSPRFSTGYFPQRNRFTVLVETHSWKPYAKRVQVMRNAIDELILLTAAHGPRWLKMVGEADLAAASIGGSTLTLDFTSGWRESVRVGGAAAPPKTPSSVRLIDFRGYAYTRRPSFISGTLVTQYDPTTPQIWRVPLRDQVESALDVTAPFGGYILPVAFATDISQRLTAHGIRFVQIKDRLDRLQAKLFRATAVTFSDGPFEGRLRTSLQGTWREEHHDIPAGSIFIPVAQPLGRLVVALFEPQAPDSFAAWGFFNAYFEQKEQMEPYVAEIAAHEVLNAHPALRAEFDIKLGNDDAFAKDPAARVEFFLKHHRAWDKSYNLYPVLRVETGTGLN